MLGVREGEGKKQKIPSVKKGERASCTNFRFESPSERRLCLGREFLRLWAWFERNGQDTREGGFLLREWFFWEKGKSHRAIGVKGLWGGGAEELIS